MTQRTARRLAWGLVTLSIVALGVRIGLFLAGARTGDASDSILVVVVPVFGVVGALVASRRPENAIGWIFVAVTVGLAAVASLIGIGEQIAADDPTAPIARVSRWLEAWTWVPLIFVPTTFPLLLFPDGRLPSRRWRPLAWAAATGMAAFSFAMGFDPANYDGEPVPLGIEPPRALVEALNAGSLLLIAGVVGGGAAVVVRFRRAGGDLRQQMKWLVYAAVVAATFLVGGFVTGGVLAALDVDVAEGTAAEVLNAIVLIGALVIPVGMGIAIVKYRLYDIDLVINRTVVYGILGAFITTVYVGVVAGVGALIGSRGNVLLSGLAAGIVAVAFQPVRHRAQRVANRLVYGKRATPYEVLSEFSGRLAGSYSLEDVLPRMARVVAEATGATRATIWLRSAGADRAAATWPLDAEPAPQRDPFEVRHQGELLGAITVETAPNEPLTPLQRQLVRDVAGQAGLVLRNVRLIEDLRASRQRLVAAQDEERRRIERNIHDGAQQQLVALSVRLRLAESLVASNPEKAAGLLSDLQRQATETLEDLRDLARGIYPPLLADRGLAAAVEAQARKAPLPVRVASDGVSRYPREVEAAVYFSVLESLQNVSKYANASSVDVLLRDGDGHLTFEIRDDGVGFDVNDVHGSGLSNMRDRMDALGGELDVQSETGRGTVVRGRVPLSIGGAGP